MKGNIYKKNYLSKVILRIDFIKSIELSKLRSYADSISSIFPLSKQIDGEEGYFDLNLQTKQLNQHTNKIVSWVFTDKNSTKNLQISPSYLFIEYLKYKNSTDLINDVEKVVNVFINSFGVKTIKRIGLRYLNEIELHNEKDYLKWDKYIANDLLGAISFANNSEFSVSRSMGQLVFKDGFNIINFNFGVWNDDYPNEVNRKSFVLDYDCYSNIPVDLSDTSIVDVVKEYNSKIEKIFELSISDSFRGLLNK
jgi:uncharacterized protein (TIGR04255 family)